MLSIKRQADLKLFSVIVISRLLIRDHILPNWHRVHDLNKDHFVSNLKSALNRDLVSNFVLTNIKWYKETNHYYGLITLLRSNIIILFDISSYIFTKCYQKGLKLYENRIGIGALTSVIVFL